MIEGPTARALARIEAVETDLAGAYTRGFSPRESAIATERAPLPDADPLSVAAPSEAYFVLGDRAAPQFTRDGGFRFVDGELRSAGGLPVLGVAANATSLGPLRVDPIDRALGRPGEPRIEGDGSLAYTRSSIDPVSGRPVTERVCVGRIAIARFPAATLPERIAGTRVTVPAGTPVHIGLPATAQFGGLVTYSRDAGRVDLNAGLLRLREAYLQFDAVRAAGMAHGSVEKTTLDLVK